MRHEAEIQQQAIAETPCTETAPCFACLRCFVTLTNILATDPNVRAHMTGVETRPAWKPAWKHAAEADGLLPSADAYRVGPISAERTITLTAAHVATLPTGERVRPPAGTVLREAPTPIQLANAEEERAILPRATRVEVRSRAGSQPIVTVEDDAGRTIRLVRVGAAEAMRHGDPPDEPKTLGEQLHDEHNRTTHADGSCCLCDPATTVLADLTERAGLPRETAPSEWPTPRAMAEIACRKRTLGQGFQSGFEEGVIAERARFEAAPLVSLADYAKPRT